MALSDEEIKNLIKKSNRSVEIQKAILHQNKLRFHAQIVDQKADAGGYYKTYMDWVKTVLTAKDKYEQFENLFTFPVATNDVIDTISDEYLRLFNAQDSYFDVHFNDSDLNQDFLDFLEKTQIQNFFQNEVFGAMFTAINSLVVVDLQPKQLGEKPEPYFYLLDIAHVIDLNYDPILNRLDYVIFKDAQNDIIVIDDASYRRFTKEQNSSEYFLSLFNAHDIGYCPVSFMWDDNLRNDNPYNKQSPISGQLARLDWYLFVSTAKKSLDIYASYPIYWSYKSKCQYKNAEGQPCEEGYTSISSSEGKLVKIPCPACESKKLVGAGSLIQVPAPRYPNDPDLREPVGKVTVDIDSLNYNVDEVDRLSDKIIELSTGRSRMDVLGKKSVNEDQVKSQFESQTNILRYLASNYEKLHEWLVDTIGKIIYADKYLGCTVSYGTKFYLQSVDDLISDFNRAKTAGLPMYLLNQKKNVIEDLMLKNSPNDKIKIEILKYLEPYSDLNLDECVRLGIQEVDFEGFALKANFAYFINKFELEYGQLTEWGIKLEISEKVKRITQILNEYVRQRFKNRKTSTSSSEATSTN